MIPIEIISLKIGRLRHMNFGYFAYVWKLLPEEIKTNLSAEWNLNHLKNKEALLDKYALIGDGYYLEGEQESDQFGTDAYLAAHPEYDRYDFISEGDSPSYFYLLQTSLRGHENPDYGGWGGRFEKTAPNLYSGTAFDYNPYSQLFEQEYTLSRWISDIQADFAARANWCVQQTSLMPIITYK